MRRRKSFSENKWTALFLLSSALFSSCVGLETERNGSESQNSENNETACAPFLKEKAAYEQAVTTTEARFQERNNHQAFVSYQTAVNHLLQAARLVRVESVNKDYAYLANIPALKSTSVTENTCCGGANKAWVERELQLASRAYYAAETVQDHLIGQAFPYKLPTAVHNAKLASPEQMIVTPGSTFRILELCAGAGYPGTVAARRAVDAGAGKVEVVFTEADPLAIAALNANLTAGTFQTYLKRASSSVASSFKILQGKLQEPPEQLFQPVQEYASSLGGNEPLQFDLIFANPPQAPAPDPKAAGRKDFARGAGGLSGTNGDQAHVQIIENATKWLRPGGELCLQYFYADRRDIDAKMNSLYENYREIQPATTFVTNKASQFWKNQGNWEIFQGFLTQGIANFSYDKDTDVMTTTVRLLCATKKKSAP